MISSGRCREECPRIRRSSGQVKPYFEENVLAASSVVKARWVFPVAGEPIAHGAVEIAAGRIVCVQRRPAADAQDLGDVAIVPAFVNAHTHLEFSDLMTPLTPARPFPSWLRALIAHRQARSDGSSAIERGLEECRRSGTAAFGEIVTQDWPARMPADVPGAVLFRELIALPPERIEQQLEIARRFLKPDDSSHQGAAVRGLSPHAPYSVHPEMFDRIIRLSADSRTPLAIHLAETEAELQLLRDGTGEIVDFLSGLGVWRDGVIPHGTRPLHYLRSLADLEHVVIAHGNYLDDEEIDFVASHRNLAVAYCPRTHAFFGHRQHPWRKIIARGGVVAIGTDGRCSNPDLSVWNELLFVSAQAPDCDPAILLQMGTLNGARALGLEAEFGTLEPGKQAKLAIIRLGDANAGDPYDELFHPASRVAQELATCRDGGD
jgi:aminodeoxyfutalosine deaminase